MQIGTCVSQLGHIGRMSCIHGKIKTINDITRPKHQHVWIAICHNFWLQAIWNEIHIF